MQLWNRLKQEQWSGFIELHTVIKKLPVPVGLKVLSNEN
jgi:hypothetical protein